MGTPRRQQAVCEVLWGVPSAQVVDLLCICPVPSQTTPSSEAALSGHRPLQAGELPESFGTLSCSGQQTWFAHT